MSDPNRFVEFVWAAYGASVVVFVWIVAETWLSARRWKRRVEQLEREQRR